MSTLVTISNLTRVFDVSRPWLNRVIERLPVKHLKAVSDVSLTISEKSVYALVGESGSGKSTIGKIVVGLLPPTKGSVKIKGVDLAREKDQSLVKEIRSDIQMIFQDPFASLNPRWRVKKIIEEPVKSAGNNTQGVSERLLELVGLSKDDANKYPHEFSGGQRQRICVARALSSEPKLIVCDEPTSALDVSVQAQVLNLMSDLKDKLGLTYLFISHDLTVVRHMADTIGVLYLGRLVEEASTEVLFSNPQHPYTQMLFDAAPRLDSFGREIDPPKGEIPDPINPPTGCSYHPRCPKAIDRCKSELPLLEEKSDRRVACHLV